MTATSSFNTINKELVKKYNRIINDIVNTYPVYKVYPTFVKYEDNYKKNINALNQLQGEIFLFQNELNKVNDTQQKEISQIDTMIHALDEKNKVLQGELTSLNNSGNAAHGMLTDAEFLYNRQLTSNWLLLLYLTSVIYVYYRRS